MSEPEKQNLPLGTTPETARLHRNIQRICYVLLFGLVIEGALTLPFTLVWYGWPTLSVQQVCSGLRQVMYSNPALNCQESYPLSGPPFGGAPENASVTTANDKWGVQPVPGYQRIGFRQLISIYRHDELITRGAKP